MDEILVGLAGRSALVAEGLAAAAGDRSPLVIAEPRLGAVQIIGLARPRGENVGRDADRVVFVNPLVPRRRSCGAVHTAVTQPEVPGLRRIAVFAANELAGPAGVVVG